MQDLKIEKNGETYLIKIHHGNILTNLKIYQIQNNGRFQYRKKIGTEVVEFLHGLAMKEGIYFNREAEDYLFQICEYAIEKCEKKKVFHTVEYQNHTYRTKLFEDSNHMLYIDIEEPIEFLGFKRFNLLERVSVKEFRKNKEKINDIEICENAVRQYVDEKKWKENREKLREKQWMYLRKM